MTTPLDLPATATQIRNWSNLIAGVAHLATLVSADRKDLSSAAQSLREISEQIRSEHERLQATPADGPPY